MIKVEQRAKARSNPYRRRRLDFPAAWRMALVLLVLLLVMAGCGKKGAPMPDYSRQLFSWRNVFATLSDEGCVSVSGSVGGEAQNLAFMVLELEPLDASCAGCPFVPQETYRVNSADAWESPDGQTFRFAYCPATRSESYRWRLVGRNVFSSLPAVPTPVRTVGAGESAAVTPLPSADALSGGDAFVRNAADESF